MHKNWLEWIVFSIASLLVATMFGYLGYEIYRGTGDPPAIEVELGPVEQVGQRFRVPVTVHNQGQQTAEAIEIEVELRSEEGPVELARFQVSHLSSGTRHAGHVVFHSDPRQAGTLRARPLGFSLP